MRVRFYNQGVTTAAVRAVAARQARQLDRRLGHVAEGLKSLDATVAHHLRDGTYTARLVLAVPDHTLAASGDGVMVTAALRAAFDDLEDKLAVYLARVREEPLIRRRRLAWRRPSARLAREEAEEDEAAATEEEPGAWCAATRRGQRARRPVMARGSAERSPTMAATVTRHAYGFGTALDAPFDEAVARTRAALKAEGFGVLTEIDVRATMKEKLGIDFERYVILGACNPPLAHRALEAERELGLLLPCNVIVHDRDGGSAVSIVDPEAMLGVVENAALRDVAREAKARLERVVARLAATGRAG